MIEKLLSPFDFVLNMPIQEQCFHAVGVSLTGFVFAAILRESCKDTRIRYAARALGAGAFIMVSVYSMSVTEKYVRLTEECQMQKMTNIIPAITASLRRGTAFSATDNKPAID
jgi:hypothetical protein